MAAKSFKRGWIVLSGLFSPPYPTHTLSSRGRENLLAPWCPAMENTRKCRHSRQACIAVHSVRKVRGLSIALEPVRRPAGNSRSTGSLGAFFLRTTYQETEAPALEWHKSLVNRVMGLTVNWLLGGKWDLCRVDENLWPLDVSLPRSKSTFSQPV